MISNFMKKRVKDNSTIRAMFEEGKRLSEIHGAENVFDFSIGNPSVETPKEINTIINHILTSENSNSIHGYMNNSGYENVREAIAESINKKNSLELTAKNIIMTCGAAGGLNIILKTILNEEDEVIVFAPFFGEYKNYVENFNGKIVIVEPNLKTFEPDLDMFKKAISSKTKAVIINSPNNPTGVIYSEDTIISLANILTEKEDEFSTSIYLISDEPYREIVYDNSEIPNVLKYYKNTFIGYSYSKSLSLPGERIGYVVVGNSMVDFNDTVAALNIANRILGFVNAPSLFQKVIAKTLEVEVDVEIYKKNRDVLYQGLTSLGIECIKPQGAFYLFPKCPIEDDVKFCEEAKKYNILLVPGSVFGCKGYFRLSYCVPYEKIVKSLEAFKAFLK